MSFFSALTLLANGLNSEVNKGDDSSSQNVAENLVSFSDEEKTDGSVRNSKNKLLFGCGNMEGRHNNSENSWCKPSSEFYSCEFFIDKSLQTPSTFCTSTNSNLNEEGFFQNAIICDNNLGAQVNCSKYEDNGNWDRYFAKKGFDKKSLDDYVSYDKIDQWYESRQSACSDWKGGHVTSTTDDLSSISHGTKLEYSLSKLMVGACEKSDANSSCITEMNGKIDLREDLAKYPLKSAMASQFLFTSNDGNMVNSKNLNMCGPNLLPPKDYSFFPIHIEKSVTQDLKNLVRFDGFHSVIFMGNIPPNMVVSKIIDLVKVFGEFQEIYYNPIPECWSTCYVLFKSIESAEKAILGLNGKKVFNNAPFHRLVCCLCRMPPSSILSCNNYHKSGSLMANLVFKCVTSASHKMREMISSYFGKILIKADYSDFLDNKHFVFDLNKKTDTYSNTNKDDDSGKWMICQKLDGSTYYWNLGSGAVHIYPPFVSSTSKASVNFSLLKDGPPGSNLFVCGVPSDWTEITLMELFQPFGHIVGIRLPNAVIPYGNRINRGYGFVSYDNSRSAITALSDLTGIKILSKAIKVQLKVGEENLLADILCEISTRPKGRLAGSNDKKKEIHNLAAKKESKHDLLKNLGESDTRIELVNTISSNLLESSSSLNANLSTSTCTKSEEKLVSHLSSWLYSNSSHKSFSAGNVMEEDNKIKIVDRNCNLGNEIRSEESKLIFSGTVEGSQNEEETEADSTYYEGRQSSGSIVISCADELEKYNFIVGRFCNVLFDAICDRLSKSTLDFADDITGHGENFKDLDLNQDIFKLNVNEIFADETSILTDVTPNKLNCIFDSIKLNISSFRERIKSSVMSNIMSNAERSFSV